MVKARKHYSGRKESKLEKECRIATEKFLRAFAITQIKKDTAHLKNILKIMRQGGQIVFSKKRVQNNKVICPLCQNLKSAQQP